MGQYDHMINLPHWEPKTRQRMSAEARAAQFAPFAALTGHNEAISETARLTDSLEGIDENDLDRMNQKMAILTEHLHVRPTVTVTYFEPDTHKDGGAYRQYTGQARLIDSLDYRIIFEDGTSIPMKYILDIESSLFKSLEEMYD